MGHLAFICVWLYKTHKAGNIHQPNAFYCSVWIVGWLGAEPPNCFLNVSNTLSYYVAYVTILVRLQPSKSSTPLPANFSQFKHCPIVHILCGCQSNLWPYELKIDTPVTPSLGKQLHQFRFLHNLCLFFFELGACKGRMDGKIVMRSTFDIQGPQA